MICINEKTGKVAVNDTTVIGTVIDAQMISAITICKRSLNDVIEKSEEEGVQPVNKIYTIHAIEVVINVPDSNQMYLAIFKTLCAGIFLFVALISGEFVIFSLPPRSSRYPQIYEKTFLCHHLCVNDIRQQNTFRFYQIYRGLFYKHNIH